MLLYITEEKKELAGIIRGMFVKNFHAYDIITSQ
jgi:hypothetical protein